MTRYENATELNRDLSALNDSGAIKGMDAREDGVYITYVPSSGADPVTKKLGDVDFDAILMDHTHTINGKNALTKSYPLTKGTYVIVTGSGVNNFGQANLYIKSSQADTVIITMGSQYDPAYLYKIEVPTDCTITLTANGRENSDCAHAITSACIPL